MRLHFASFYQKMVGPAAKREAVAHLQAVMSLSERGLLDRGRGSQDDPLSF